MFSIVNKFKKDLSDNFRNHLYTDKSDGLGFHLRFSKSNRSALTFVYFKSSYRIVN